MDAEFDLETSNVMNPIPKKFAHITEDRSQPSWLGWLTLEEEIACQLDHSDFESQSVFAPRCIFPNLQTKFATSLQNKLTSVPVLRGSVSKYQRSKYQ